MLADNIRLLKKKYPDLYQRVRKWEEGINKPLFLVEQAKDGNDTLKYQNGDQTVYMNSKYKPIREAELIVDQILENEVITSETHMVFYGIGLGYHIDYFTKRYTEASFSIIEPSIEIFSLFLDRKSLKDLQLKRLVSLECGNNMQSFYNDLNQSKEKRFVICELPVYAKVFNQMYTKFLYDFKKFIKEQLSSISVNYTFKKRWIINSVNNLKEVLLTPNILMENKDMFKEKTVLLVAAGPSLDYEIDSLRKIKEEGRAYIFTVGSAINTLLHHDIYPHAMCTYDPSEMNQVVFKKTNELEISTIPMIFGSSVGYETLEQYPGPKYHMITSQDTIASCLLKPESNEALEKVNDAPSIAVVTLELLAKLRFKQIILVGQNFAYLDNKSYAEGIEYNQNRLNLVNDNNSLTVKDVSGNDVTTNDTFVKMKNMMEIIIEQYKIVAYNTTIGGADIKGAPFKELNDLFDIVLVKNSIVDDNFQIIKRHDIYDKTYIMEQLSNLQGEFENYKKILSHIRKCLHELKEAVSINNARKVNDIHTEMDQWSVKMEKNLFFTVLALPLNRVEYGLLVNTATSAKREKNHIVIAKTIFEPTEIFINLLYCDMELNEQIMVVLKNTVGKYIGVNND